MSEFDSLEELRSELLGAATHLREKGDYHFFNGEPNIFTTDELATLIEHLAEQLDGKNIVVIERLWGIFAPTCTWDDARGAAQIANAVFEKLDTLYRPHYVNRDTTNS